MTSTEETRRYPDELTKFLSSIPAESREKIMGEILEGLQNDTIPGIKQSDSEPGHDVPTDQLSWSVGTS